MVPGASKFVLESAGVSTLSQPPQLGSPSIVPFMQPDPHCSSKQMTCSERYYKVYEQAAMLEIGWNMKGGQGRSIEQCPELEETHRAFPLHVD